jgi:chromosome partitioning protein
LSFDPTARTINKVLAPRGIPYIVVINNWDPRDTEYDLNETKEFVRANGWPLAHTVIRRYKIHARSSAEGLVVTQYQMNRTTLHAREDFYKLALELNVGGAS